MDERIIDLETQIAYQAREISELNTIVIRLRDTVEQQEKRLDAVTKAMHDVAPSHIKDLEEESPPPHY